MAGPDDFDESEEEDEFDFDCGMTPDGLCQLAGTEGCWECPYRDPRPKSSSAAESGGEGRGEGTARASGHAGLADANVSAGVTAGETALSLHRPPPKVESAALPEIPAGVVVDGRLCWPEHLHYAIEGDPDVGGESVSPWPPAAREPRSVMLRRRESQRDMSPGVRQDRTAPYRLVVHDGSLAVVERLRRAGLLDDPRHTGRDRTLVDERRAPGA